MHKLFSYFGTLGKLYPGHAGNLFKCGTHRVHRDKTVIYTRVGLNESTALTKLPIDHDTLNSSHCAYLNTIMYWGWQRPLTATRAQEHAE